MKKSDAHIELNPPDISPIRGNLKHQITPQRPRRKTSRKDQGADVHSSSSTPNRLQSSLQSNSYNSPSDSFPYSQEHRPDVYWDYTSPKLPKGAKKRDIKITVDEFLKNLTQHKAPQCNTQTSRYIKLLEEWMTKQNTPIIKQPPKNVRRDNKLRSRRVIEEMKQFMESIQKKKEDVVAECNPVECIDKISTPKANTSNYLNLSLDKKSFLDGDGTEHDSSDELWGEVDNSFIVKATQQLEVCSNINFLDKNSEIISTIPETVNALSIEPSQTISEMGLDAEINLNNRVLDIDLHAQILLTQIVNCDWDSASDCEDWDNGFIEEDEALSLIPDEVLCGADLGNSQKNDKTDQSTVTNTDEVKNFEDAQSIKTSSNVKILERNKSDEISFGCSESDRGTGQASNISGAELFNDFLEDDSFDDDEAILSKPEVLSWIDEVESKLSQSQQQCTPEEIERKKDEAIQRRKNKR